MSQHDVLGIGAPIIDYIFKVDRSFLEYLSGDLGGMELVDLEAFSRLARQAKSTPHKVVGGSACNVMRTLRHCGQKTAFLGVVGDDEEGKWVEESLKELGVVPFLSRANLPTARVASFVNDEGRRTFRSCYGANKKLSQEHLLKDYFSGVRLVHIEGYSLLLGVEFVREAMRRAKDAGALISFDCASFEVVREYREVMQELIEEKIDILFGNHREMEALLGSTPKEACETLRHQLNTVAVSLGKEGCVVGNSTGVHACPAYPVNALDTTGAGDLFASGFLDGYLRGLSPVKCADRGARIAHHGVQVWGSELTCEQWQQLTQNQK